ncbi:o-succinylbenzoate synthase [Heyndrickxia ginsengihumi]|uniref:o-succinylbenzoate synthase n=1 Tax=Heyndrickxia ginsengihumi TaxID=363870 RepID=UPI003D1FA1B3
MKIQHVHLSIIKMPLKSPFANALETVTERESIILEVIDHDGVAGYGEVVAFSTPWYTEETVKTCYHLLKDVLIPIVLDRAIEHPKEISERFQAVRGNPMAKAGIETAIWDLYAKRKNLPLWKLIGGTRESVLSGVVVGTHDSKSALNQIEQFMLEGYERVKVKIKPGHDYDFLQLIRTHYPYLSLMADANSSYTLNDLPLLKSLDRFNLLMIEQPLAVDDIVEHAALQKQMQTPICLDESIVTYHDAESAIRLRSMGVLNIKIGRVGGLWNAIQLHNLCLKHSIPVWCGGMIEFGISRAFNIALATLEGFTIPGDISSSNRFWEKDIITPEVHVRKGKIQAPMQAGIGFNINKQQLIAATIYSEKIVKRGLQ